MSDRGKASGISKSTRSKMFWTGVVSTALATSGAILWSAPFEGWLSPRGTWQLNTFGFMVFCLGAAGMMWLLLSFIVRRFLSESDVRAVRSAIEGFSKSRLSFLCLTACIFALYWRTLGFSFFGDDFYLLNIVSEGPLRVLFPFKDIYHYFPVTLFLIGIPRWLGIGDASTYHFINLAMHCVNAGLVYLIARELLDSRFEACMSAILFAFFFLMYDPVMWPLVGNHYVVSAFFALFSFLLFLRYRRGGAMRHFYGFALFYCLAIYTHEIAIPLIGACFFYDMTNKEKDEMSISLKRLKQSLRIYFIPVAALALLWGIKYFYTARIVVSHNSPFKVLQSLGASACFFSPFNNMNIYWIFSRWGQNTVFLLAVVVAIATAIIICYAKARREQRVMLAWSVVFALPSIIAAEPSPRYFYLVAVGWAMLWATAVTGAANAIDKPVPANAESRSGETERFLRYVAAGLLCLCIVLQGQRHALHLVGIWHHGSDIIKAAVESTDEMLKRNPETKSLIVVDQPTWHTEDSFFGAPLLIQSMHYPLKALTDSDLPDVKSVNLNGENVFDKSFPQVSMGELEAASADPDTLVIIYNSQAQSMTPYEKGLR